MISGKSHSIKNLMLNFIFNQCNYFSIKLSKLGKLSYIFPLKICICTQIHLYKNLKLWFKSCEGLEAILIDWQQTFIGKHLKTALLFRVYIRVYRFSTLVDIKKTSDFYIKLDTDPGFFISRSETLISLGSVSNDLMWLLPPFLEKQADNMCSLEFALGYYFEQVNAVLILTQAKLLFRFYALSVLSKKSDLLTKSSE